MSLQIIASSGLLLAGLAGTAAVMVKTGRQRQPKETPNVYGSARFMNEEELKQSGLLVETQPVGASGVYIGGWRDQKGRLHYLRDISNGHVLVCGPTRSGKGLSCILPTLLTSATAAIVNDEKGELYIQTGPWRATHVGPVVRWEPGSINWTARWNPLLEVRFGSPNEIADAQNIALMMIDAKGGGFDRLDHWEKATIPLLTALALHELYDACATGRVASLGDIAARFADPTTDAMDLYEEMRDNQHLGGGPFSSTIAGPGVPYPHLAIAAQGRAQLDRSEKERSSVLSSLLTFITLFHDPIVCANTADSDFRLTDIADGPKPMTVYARAAPNDTIRLRPLFRLFYTMAIRALMEPDLIYVDNQPKNPHRHETLIPMDEFPSFGRLDEINSGLAKAASWGIRFLLSIQDLTQLDGIYGKGNSIIANTHTKLYFTPNDLSTAKTLSESTGIKTELTEHTTISGKRFGPLSQVTRSIHATARPLMTAGEILAMPAAVKDADGRVTGPGNLLIFLTGHRPLCTQQMLYFQDPDFASRAATPWPAPQAAALPPAPLLLPWIPALPPPSP